MQKIEKLVAGPSTAERKGQRKLSGHRLLFLQLKFCFISLYELALFVLHFTFLMQKFKKLVAGTPTAEPHAMAQFAQWVFRYCRGDACYKLVLRKP